MDVFAEIEELRQLKVGALRSKYHEVFGKNPDRRTSSFYFVASPGVCWRGWKEISVSARAGERSRSLTTRTFESVLQRAFLWNPVSPQDHLTGRELEEIGGFPPLARCSPGSLRTAGSSSRFLRTALNINPSNIAR